MLVMVCVMSKYLPAVSKLEGNMLERDSPRALDYRELPHLFLETFLYDGSFEIGGDDDGCSILLLLGEAGSFVVTVKFGSWREPS
jgi:hypothetical protein